MGYSNPPISWSEFERALSTGRRPGAPPVGADGGDSPAWSNKRMPYVPVAEALEAATPVIPYAELHAHSNFSFLDGASSPEQLLEEAKRLGLHALGLTDHDGFYGIVRMAEAAESYDIKTVFGAELSLGLRKPQNGVADPEGSHLVVLARGEEGYHRLAAALTSGQLTGQEKGRPTYDLEELAERAGGYWTVLTGCRKGAVRKALRAGASSASATAEVDRLIELFGHDNVVVELFDHGDPLASNDNDMLASIATSKGLRMIATGNVHYATPDQYRLATAMAAVRARRSLDELDGWLPASGSAHLRSGAEMATRFARYPGAIENTVEIADSHAFELRKVRPGLPKQDVPAGETDMSWLRKLVWQGAAERYPNLSVKDRARIERELDVIEQK
ncbi:MAG TPA: PHP domain-containing protein, partial [Galbitalea sp.]